MATTLIKNEVLVRVYIVLFLLIAGAVVIISKAIRISVIEGKVLREQVSDKIRTQNVEAERGNILTETGELLSTSIPVFDVAFDPNSSGIKPGEFESNVDSLADAIANYVDQTYTPGGYRDYLIKMKKDGKRYVVIKRNASFGEKEMMSQFPLFNQGQFAGGFIATRNFRRDRPYGLLARRTIGYIRENAKPVGLEAYFDEQLRGEDGEQLMLLVDPTPNKEVYIPINDRETIKPKRGNDIVCTIDIELQSITENALLRAMNHHNAEWGTAIVMEVKTGKIKAIANLGQTSEGWWETYNYAVGQLIEPGSTFKLASMMALLEDGHVRLQDSIPLFKGRTEFYGEEMVDSYAHSYEKGTVQRAFEISSNVGISTMVDYFYNKKNDVSGQYPGNAGRFIEQLKRFNLNLPTGVEIGGERTPYIKEAYNTEDNWSGTTLPWMSIGYEVMLTPLQMLTFYNAVANDGVMMRPYLVTEIQHLGETIETVKPVVVDEAISSRRTIRQVQELLEGVVENGTARKMRTDQYSFAGKTGTAQVGYQKLKQRTKLSGYQASFAGYFPADDPLYSCIVVINKPTQNGYYGATVAGPVFREIADKAFATKIDLHAPINIERDSIHAVPAKSVGEVQDMAYLMQELEFESYGKPASDWVVLRANRGDSLKVMTRRISNSSVPNVVGMGLRDALYLLENRNLKVKARGVGVVKEQSLKAGSRVPRNGTIWLRLG